MLVCLFVFSSLPNNHKVWKGKVELSQKIFNFTEDQDLKIKLGYDIARNRPYGQLRENNWTLDTGKRMMQQFIQFIPS